MTSTSWIRRLLGALVVGVALGGCGSGVASSGGPTVLHSSAPADAAGSQGPTSDRAAPPIDAPAVSAPEEQELDARRAPVAPAVTATPEVPPADPVAEVPWPDPCVPARGGAPAGTVAWLDIEALGMHLPIVPGGQGTIDSGVVAHYRAPDWLPPVAPGSPGAYWLAAHSTCGLFATLSLIPDGAEIVIRPIDGGVVATYRVADRTAFNGGGPVAWSDFYRYGSDRPYAVLQSCVPGNRRLIIYALGA